MLIFAVLVFMVHDSNWLVKTESGVSRLSRWVWIIAFILILVSLSGFDLALHSHDMQSITGASVLGWYFTRNTGPAPPKAVGGKGNQPAGPESTDSHFAGGIITPSILHVSPTLTLKDKRGPLPSAMPGGVIDYHAYRDHGRIHQRSHVNRRGFH
jgi:hypothetical protein